jgi:hypothetical protein
MLFSLYKFQSLLLFSSTERQHIKHYIVICLNLLKSAKNNYESVECSLLRKGNKSRANSDAVTVVKTTAAGLFMRSVRYKTEVDWKKKTPVSQHDATPHAFCKMAYKKCEMC